MAFFSIHISKRVFFQNFRFSTFSKFFEKRPGKVVNQTLSTFSSSVTIIVGATGSGKTTQVPQYILENAAEQNQSCRIFFSQPRKLAAISCAQRIAAERGEEVGTEIGYQVRLESKNSSTTSCVLCTHGVLLRTFMGCKDRI